MFSSMCGMRNGGCYRFLYLLPGHLAGNLLFPCTLSNFPPTNPAPQQRQRLQGTSAAVLTTADEAVLDTDSFDAGELRCYPNRNAALENAMRTRKRKHG